MLKKIIFLLFVLLLVSGCNNLEETKEGLECQDDNDCVSVFYDREICKDNKCIEVQCVFDGNCLRTLDSSFSNNIGKCIDNTCVYFLDDCIEVAKKDFNMENPECRFFDKCFCEDYIIDSPEKRIERDNSIQIISEKGHYENYVTFELK